MKELETKDKVLRANIDLHSVLANTYDTEQPHYRPENRALVSAKLAELADSAGNDLLIDFGCGTGFVIQLAVPHFNFISGVDITPAMLSMIDKSSGKVKLYQANTEAVPLEAKTANVITANSYLHHLYDIRPTIAEAYRLLKDGGVFYSEEDPNFYFWEAIKDPNVIEEAKNSDSVTLKREISAILEVHKKIGEKKGMDPNIVKMAEYQKIMVGGMRAEELYKIFYQTGFSKVNIEYYWFLGQAKIMHQSADLSHKIQSYLHSILPLSKHLFKYFKIEAWK
ncbi:class I SAM-dependent methyltransferase [bacterium]|nr:class I SAM-dependent methyltransferase [bacterium]